MGLDQVVQGVSPRRARRIAFLRPVHLRTLDQGGPAKRMFAANLSRGGMFIRSPTLPAVGTRVEVLLEARGRVLRFAEATVTFLLPRDQAVARGRLPGFGVRFTRLSPRSRALVDHLLTLVPEQPPRRLPPHRRPPATDEEPVARTNTLQRLWVRAVAAVTLGSAMALGAWNQLPSWLGP